MQHIITTAVHHPPVTMLALQRISSQPLAEPVMASGSNTHLAGAFAAAAILTSVCQSAASSASAFVWDVTKTPGCLLGLAAARLLATTGTSPTPAKTEQRQQPFKVAAAPLELQRKPSQPGELQLELPQLPSSQKQQQLGSSQFKAAAAFKRPSLKPSISSTRKTSALSSPTSAKAAVHWAAKGMAAEHDCQLREALACYQKAVDLAPDSVIHLCALAKAWSDLSYEEGMPEAERLELNRKAVEIADKIVAMNPTVSAADRAGGLGARREGRGQGNRVRGVRGCLLCTWIWCFRGLRADCWWPSMSGESRQALMWCWHLSWQQCVWTETFPQVTASIIWTASESRLSYRHSSMFMIVTFAGGLPSTRPNPLLPSCVSLPAARQRLDHAGSHPRPPVPVPGQQAEGEAGKGHL